MSVFPTSVLGWALGIAHLGILGLVVVNVLALAVRRRRRRALQSWPRISVLVPARNEADNLRRLLPSLLDQNYPGGVQVVVVDDASEDTTWDVIQQHAREHPSGNRLLGVKEDGPPPGWVGKVHALYQAAAHADGEVFLFLDADARLASPDALRGMVEQYAASARDFDPGARGRHEPVNLGAAEVALTGLPSYRDTGPAALLTSLVPFAVLSALPVPLVPRIQSPSLSALNGQVWMISAAAYRRLRPHEANRNEVLEDVMIGRFLKRNGVRLTFEDMRSELEVVMYGSFGEAWRGFRKNAYLLAGNGRPVPFLIFFTIYCAFFVVAPWVAGAFLITLYAFKGAIDRWGRLPWFVTPAAPLVLTLGALLQLDSAWSHARGAVEWKGRRVG